MVQLNNGLSIARRVIQPRVARRMRTSTARKLPVAGAPSSRRAMVALPAAPGVAYSRFGS
jgi:hypothetical protein